MAAIKNNKIVNKRHNKKKRIKNVEFGDFTLVKDVIITKTPKINRILPHWLSHPIYIKRNLDDQTLKPKESCPVLNLKLAKQLYINGIKYLFPVQQVIITEILARSSCIENRFNSRDLCVATPTGSGKTLAYVIPIIQSIGQKPIRSLQAIVLLPVVELAKQVLKVFNIYASTFRIKVGQAFGIETFSTEQRELVKKVYNEYHCNVDILIATPGRLWEHMLNTPGLDLSQIRFFILDEADKLFVGEGGDIISRIQHHIVASKNKKSITFLPPFFHSLNNKSEVTERGKSGEVGRSSEDSTWCIPSIPMQRLLFSATLSHDPQQLQNLSLYRPILFTAEPESGESVVNSDYIGKVARPSGLKEEWIKVDTNIKPLMLHYLLHKERKKSGNFKTLVFTNSLELTSKITILLKELSKGKYSVDEFSSRLSKARKKKLTQFTNGSLNVLVSSDATARGIDFANIDCVISYDVPSSNTYIHRIGRTARAGKSGRAISLITEDEIKQFRKIIGPEFASFHERIIPEYKLEKLERRFKLSLEILSKTLRMRKQKGAKKIPIMLKRNNKISKKNR